MDSEISTRAVGLMEVAERAWLQALGDFYHPPLPEPKVEYEDDKTSYFYIDPISWTVHLNTAGVPLHLDMNGAAPFLLSICQHEIQHYLVCPFDGVTHGMMFAAARSHVNDPTAMFVCNLFADLVVDSRLLKRVPSLTHDRIMTSLHDSSIRTLEHSRLWSLIVACYRQMWGFPIPPMVKADEPTLTSAQAIVAVTHECLDDESRWPKAAKEIARVLAEWQPEEKGQLLGCDEPGSSSKNGQLLGSPILVPLDVDAIMGSPVEIRNGDRAKHCIESASEQDVEEEMGRLAIEVDWRGGGLSDLQGVYLVAGVGYDPYKWVQFWYRARAKGLLRSEIRERTVSGATPLASQVWRLGDPIEELDLVQSLQAFPVIVPNMSTRKWVTTFLHGAETMYSPPDLLIVIDSSGSMTYSMTSKRVSGPYHTALVSAFAALDLALKYGRRVAAINFSDGIHQCDWTNDRSAAESVLLQYQGGGTVAPVKAIVESCRRAQADVMVLMVTDAEIHNWENLLDSVREMIRLGHKFFMFRIGSRERAMDEAGQSLCRAGAVVIPVASAKDLPGLVIREARRVYVGGRHSPLTAP